ncbi:MAG: hypothetical protein NTX66_04440 [Candidatus Falkowbacteria bacterium]|nr:hypothetical protein [Candidatus Falkowbacteria bacterium]
MDKKVVFLGMIFGSTIGGYLPTVFGVNALSLVSILCAAAGGIIGIWLSYRLLN